MHPNEKRGTRPLKFGAVLAVAAAGAALAAPSFGQGAGELVANMNGKQVVPAGTGAPNGTGQGEFKVRPQRQVLRYEVTFERTRGAVRGYIFRGKRGEEPPNPQRPAVTLFDDPKPSPQSGRVTGLRTRLLQRMKQRPRRFHVVLVNQRYENGAVRGQLKRP